MIKTLFRSACGHFETWAWTLFSSMAAHPNSAPSQTGNDTGLTEDEESDRFERGESFYWGSGIFGHW